MELLAEEASRVARELGLPEKLPVTETDLVGAYVPPPGLAERIGAVGTISTSNYNYYMSVGYKFSFLDRVDLHAECERLRREYRWPLHRVDTNGAHRFATQLLSRVSMDVQALERDCTVAVHPTFPESARGEWFVPVYWVYWVRRGEDRPVASVQFAEPTGGVLQLRVGRSDYILRRPIQPPPTNGASGSASR